MKQVLQDMAKGGTSLVDAPAPLSTPEYLVIDTCVSLISAGTERMLVDFGKANVVQKARQQPEKVKQVLDKVQTDGLVTTIDAVRSKLGQPLPLGYCNVGRVKEAGLGVKGFLEGDRVVSNGPHADVVRVPKNLCVKIPDSVSDDAAAFTVLASIGLQGIRLAEPTLGEAFVVTGVGLIGLLTVQLLRAHGCRVLAIDYDAVKLELASSFGAEICNPGAGQDPIAAAHAFSRGIGVDAVIIAASTKSNDPVSQAATMCRQRGRIVLVGVTGLELSRADFYQKELSFQVSCSYGPGRYDPAYEEEGQDYPVGFVRWTQQRNFEAVLDMLASGQLDVSGLVTHSFKFEEATDAYRVLTEEKNALGIMLRYEHPVESRHVKTVVLSSPQTPINSISGAAVVGFIGAGNYASRMLMPAFKAAGASLHTVASSGGTSGVVHGGRSGFSHATSDSSEIIHHETINTVAIVTRHDSHAQLTVDALKAGKHVFVEKPLALNADQLQSVKSAYEGSGRHLMVGFNRRFAPQVQIMKKLLSAVSQPKSFVMVMNAGAIPPDHWTQDPSVGGGRIIGEACHYIDLMRYLAGSPIVSVQSRRIGDDNSMEITEDKAVIVLGFDDGSFGTIHYLANGGSSFPKERIEVFAAGGTLQLDNFVSLRGFGWKGFSKEKLWRQDKGQKLCVAAFLNAIKSDSDSPIPAEELFEVAQITIEVAEELRSQS